MYIHNIMKVVEVCTCVVFQCILVGGRDSIGEAAVERPCRQASVSLLWWQPKKVIYCNSSSSQTTSSIPGKFIDCYRIAGFLCEDFNIASSTLCNIEICIIL